MIEYKFPVVTFRGDDYDDADTCYYDARLEPVQCRFDPYEAKLTALNGTYDIILGYSSKSRFLCVPNKGFGCNVEAPWLVDENIQNIINATENLCFEEATAISYALFELYNVFKVRRI